MSDGPRPQRSPGDRARAAKRPMWQQAATGIGLVTLGALAAIAVGVLMAAVVTWLF